MHLLHVIYQGKFQNVSVLTGNFYEGQTLAYDRNLLSKHRIIGYYGCRADLPQSSSSSPCSQSMSLSQTHSVGIQVHSPGCAGSQRNRCFLQLQATSLSTSATPVHSEHYISKQTKQTSPNGHIAARLCLN